MLAWWGSLESGVPAQVSSWSLDHGSKLRGSRVVKSRAHGWSAMSLSSSVTEESLCRGVDALKSVVAQTHGVGWKVRHQLRCHPRDLIEVQTYEIHHPKHYVASLYDACNK
ncbi:hypothetical protein TNCV_4044141 [Trichonephila clavipes]|nr:hypothetical protein TNCV_4044141 [Trichonephila clavipes]